MNTAKFAATWWSIGGFAYLLRKSAGLRLPVRSPRPVTYSKLHRSFSLTVTPFRVRSPYAFTKKERGVERIVINGVPGKRKLFGERSSNGAHEKIDLYGRFLNTAKFAATWWSIGGFAYLLRKSAGLRLPVRSPRPVTYSKLHRSFSLTVTPFRVRSPYAFTKKERGVERIVINGVPGKRKLFGERSSNGAHEKIDLYGRFLNTAKFAATWWSIGGSNP